MRALPFPPFGLLAIIALSACSESTAFAVRNGPDASSGGASGNGGAGGGAGLGGNIGTGGFGGAATGGIGGSAGSGGTAGASGAGGTGGMGGTSGSAGTGGTGGLGGTAGTGGTGGGDAGTCASNIRITEIDVGSAIVANESESNLMPIVLSPLPGGGSRLAWMDAANNVRVAELDANDMVRQATVIALPAHDLADFYADDRGGTLLVSRDARGGGTNNCGTLANLCGTNLPASESCYDMYLVRFDGATETWAAKLTDSTPALPPYSTGPNGPNVAFIWSAYAHHGRIAFDGSRYAAYFGSAFSSSDDCTNGGGTNGRGINVYQGDRLKIVGADGSLQTGGFDLGCSTSGYERIVWDAAARKFVAICKTGNRIAYAPPGSGTSMTIYSIDPSYANLGNIVASPAGGYWLSTSVRQSGQPTTGQGFADVRLLHFSTGMADSDLLLASDATLNERAPHLAAYGATRLLAAWETSTSSGELTAGDRNRKLFVQARNATTGVADGPPVNVVAGFVGNRYQDFRAFPDGSVAYAAPGNPNTRIWILRILPCSP